MDKAKIIENNIIDLKIGLELAEIAENDFLKNYSENLRQRRRGRDALSAV